MKRNYFLILIFLCLRAISNGQVNSPIPPSALGVHFLYNLFENPENSAGEKYRTGVAGLAVSYQKGITHHFEFSASLSGSILDFITRNNIDLGNGSKQLLLELDASVRYMFLTNQHIVKPFVQAGIGGSNYNSYFGSYIPAGIGFQINVTPSSFILLNAQKRIALTDNQDDHYHFSIGLVGDIGRRKIVKRKPIASIVPKDSDGDGILDVDDACPLVPGVLKYKGCPIPDRDGDGINDDEDKCPDVPGILRYAGCPIPDRDGDGINDEIDLCPNVPGVVRYKGCPIPDRDGDGLNDETDDCPDKPGPISNKGCPIITEEIVNRINLAARNCFFETGSYRLLSKSYESLNEVVSILKSDTALTLVIEGHTDNVGKENANQTLSKNRAKSVLDYLVAKGIQAGRLHAAGFGQSKPIETNNTADGRAKNRRVEMILSIYSSDKPPSK